jgi:hypothetical protein
MEKNMPVGFIYAEIMYWTENVVFSPGLKIVYLGYLL